MTNERPESESVSHEVSSADFSEKSLLKQFAGSLFGFDFFISYAWADARDYAVELAERLEREVDGKSYSCFLDSNDYSKGDDWKEMGHDALKKTSILILVGSPRALESKPVLREVRIYKERKNRIIPIEFIAPDDPGTLDPVRNPSPLHEFIRPEILRIQEPLTYRADAPKQLAGPSEDVVKQITGSFDLISQSDKRARIFGVAAVVFAVVAVLAIVFWRTSDANRKEAERQTKKAEQKTREVQQVGAASMLNSGHVAIEHEHDLRKALVWYGQAAITAEPGSAQRLAALNLIGSWGRSLRFHSLLHDGPVMAAVFSPDGNTLATASDDRTVQLWDVATGQPRAELLQHEHNIDHLTFNADGSTLATWSTYGSAQLWDVATGKQCGGPFRHDDGNGISQVAFLDDSITFATTGRDETRFWNVVTAEQSGEALRHRAEIETLAFSADGSTLFTSTFDGMAQLLEVMNGNQLGASFQLNERISKAVFSPDGRTLATISSLGGIGRLRDVATRELRGDSLTEVNSLVYSPDSSILATTSHDHTARLWEVATGKPRLEPLRHDDIVWSAAFTSDGSVLATASGDPFGEGEARLWDVATGKLLRAPFRHEGSIESVAISADGNTMATASQDQTARLWDIAMKPRVEASYRSKVHSIAFNLEGDTLAVASEDNTVHLTNVTTPKPRGAPLHHDDKDSSVTFDPDLSTFATVSLDKRARLWDMATGTQRGAPLALNDVILVTYDADGRTLATLSFDNSVRLWDVMTGKLLRRTLNLDGGPTISMAFSPDRKILGTVRGLFDETGQAQLWDVGTGRPCGPPFGDKDRVRSLAFSADSRTFATANWNNTARLWDLATGQPRGEPLRHDGPVYSVAFSRNGSTLATASDDGTVRLWDVATGNPRGEPLRHKNTVRSVAISPDGSTVATASDEGNEGAVWLWEEPPPAADEPERLWLSIEVRTWHTFENALIRPLTHEEWRVRKSELDKLGGPCDVRSWQDLSAAEHAELRQPRRVAR